MGGGEDDAGNRSRPSRWKKCTPEEKAEARRKRTERELARAALEEKAIRLRLSGASYDDIARELGFHDRSGAKKVVYRGVFAKRDESAREYRALEWARLEDLELTVSKLQEDVLAFQEQAKAAGRPITLAQLEKIINSWDKLVSEKLKLQDQRAKYRKTQLDPRARVTAEPSVTVADGPISATAPTPEEAARLVRQTFGEIAARRHGGGDKLDASGKPGRPDPPALPEDPADT